MKRWYLLYTKPKGDTRAQNHLLNQGYEVFRPMLRSYKIIRGTQKTSVESLFPRYIFIKLDKESSDWSRLRSTRGVMSLVSFNQVPAQIPDSLVNELIAETNSEGVVDNTKIQSSLFKEGEEVEISEGSFFGLRAIVKAQTSEERVTVLLNILGSRQSISMPIASLRLA